MPRAKPREWVVPEGMEVGSVRLHIAFAIPAGQDAFDVREAATRALVASTEHWPHGAKVLDMECRAFKPKKRRATPSPSETPAKEG